MLGNENRAARSKDTSVAFERYLGNEKDDFVSGVTTRRPSRVSVGTLRQVIAFYKKNAHFLTTHQIIL